MEKEEEKLELRMYGIVPYNISPIQQGIQFGHSTDEKAAQVIKNLITGHSYDKVYVDWLFNWKTYIILNGGTTNKRMDTETGAPLGSLNQHLLQLIENNIKFTTFSEEDLGDQLTGITFIVDERVFLKDKYPDFRTVLEDIHGGSGKLNSAIKRHLKNNIYTWKPDIKKMFPDHYKRWCETLGNKENVFLREFLKPFKLA